jgi:dipeptidase E
MRILLTSSGLPAKAENIRAEFLRLVRKSPVDIKVAFIPTASAVEADRTFMEVDRKELEEVGIPVGNITDLELDHLVIFEELKRYDVVFVDGGNTFYLLEKVQSSGFDEAIKQYLTEDLGVYVGVSAGSIIMGPDIGFVGPWDDERKANLKETKALGYTKEAYSPHYTDEEKGKLEECRAKADYSIIELRDGQAVVIDGGEQKIIH